MLYILISRALFENSTTSPNPIFQTGLIINVYQEFAFILKSTNFQMKCQSQENLRVVAAVTNIILPQYKINITLSTLHSSTLFLLQAHLDLDIPFNILESLDKAIDG
jgi:hypothetical protein